jgi:hypothetical protein
MLFCATPPTQAHLDRFTLVNRLLQDDPQGLQILLHMEGRIFGERRSKERCDKAAARLIAGDHKWVDEIRTSNEYEVWTLLGRSIAEAFKTLKGQQ